GKLWGIIGATIPYLVAYAVPALLLACLAGPAAVGWTVFGIVLAWPAMYFVGAVGMWYSVSARSSWQGLLATLGVGYIGGFMVCSFSVPIILLLSGIFFGLCALVGILPGGGTALNFQVFLAACLILGWAWLFGKLASSYILRAQKWVVGRER